MDRQLELGFSLFLRVFCGTAGGSLEGFGSVSSGVLGGGGGEGLGSHAVLGLRRGVGPGTD